MKSVKTLIAGSVLTCALATPAVAQTSIDSAPLVPQRASFTYDASTGVLTRTDPQAHLPTPQRGAPQTVAGTRCFVNEFDPSVFWAITSAGQELVDWGIKGCSGTNALAQVQFGYVTESLDPSFAGPGATMDLALYSGTAGTVPSLGTEVVRIPLSGLPGTDGTGPFFWIIDLTYLAPAEVAPVLPNGKIGWGYTNVDGVTWPLLVPVEASVFGPDIAGYEADTTSNKFDDISETGTSLALSGFDDSFASVSVDFDFEFYGSTVTSFDVSTNGFMTDGGSPFDFSNGCIPSGSNPNRMISPGFDDYSTVAAGDIYFETKGTAPCRVLIVQWDEIQLLNDFTSTLTMQAKLFELDHSIEFHYETLVQGSLGPVDGRTATVGIQGDAGLGEGLEIGCNRLGSMAVGRSYRITKRRENYSGTIDLVNLYAAPASDASFLSSVAFELGPGVPAFLASTHLVLYEEDGTCGVASNAPFSVPANPDVFTSSTPPAFETTWVGEVDVSSFTNPTVTYFALAGEFSPCGGAGACSTIFGDLLINPATIVLDDLAIPSGGVSVHEIGIPVLLSACGQTFYAQAAVADDDGAGPLWTLTNALDVTLGY